MTTPKELTSKRALFVQEYLVDLNATRAAIRAGFKEETAYSQGQRLLKNVDIQSFIQQAKDERSKRTQVTVDRVLKEYAKLGFLDPRKFYDNNGNLIPIHKLPADVAATLTGMDVSTSFTKDGDSLDTLKKIKFADKKTALDSIAKHLGMFIERIHHGLDETMLNTILAGMGDRAKSVKKELIALALKKKKV